MNPRKSLLTVLLSGGLASAYVAILLRESRPVLLHTDTKWETQDTYVFMEQVANHVGLPITRLADGRTPEQLFWDEHMLGNNRVPICSHKLKTDQTVQWVEEQRLAGWEPILHFGITPGKDEHRAKRIEDRYTHMPITPVACRFPLLHHSIRLNDWSGLEVNNTNLTEFFRGLGIQIPTAYAQGFEHNNCSGGCVRAGLGHWAWLLRVRPEVYKLREDMEERFNRDVVPLTKNQQPATILKRNGQSLSLCAFRQRLEAGLEPRYPQPTYDSYDEVPCECTVE